MRPLLPPLLLLAACTHRQHIADAHTLGGETVEVSVAGRVVPAEAIETPSGVVFRDDSGRIITMNEVTRVEVERTGQGAVEGLAWGALAGGVVGAVAGFADGDDPPCGDLCIFNMRAEEKAVFGAFILGSVGGLAGLIVGAVVGATDVYEYPDGTHAVVTPGGPRGSVAGVTVSF